MARFRKVSVTTYDDSGIPDFGATRDEWVNLEQIESIQCLVVDTYFHSVRYIPSFYPHLRMTMSSGCELVLPLEDCGTDEEAQAATHAAVAAFLT